MSPYPLRTRLFRSLSRFIGWFFGALWALLGAFALPRPYDRAGCALAVVIALIFLLRLWKREPPPAAARPLFKTSAYLIAVAAELLGMYTAVRVLPRFGAQQEIYSAVGCIVGLHFVGLWLATRSPRFLHITAGMCFVSLLSLIMPFTWHTIGLRHLLLGAGIPSSFGSPPAAPTEVDAKGTVLHDLARRVSRTGKRPEIERGCSPGALSILRILVRIGQQIRTLAVPEDQQWDATGTLMSFARRYLDLRSG